MCYYWALEYPMCTVLVFIRSDDTEWTSVEEEMQSTIRLVHIRGIGPWTSLLLNPGLPCIIIGP